MSNIKKQIEIMIKTPISLEKCSVVYLKGLHFFLRWHTSSGLKNIVNNLCQFNCWGTDLGFTLRQRVLLTWDQCCCWIISWSICHNNNIWRVNKQMKWLFFRVKWGPALLFYLRGHYNPKYSQAHTIVSRNYFYIDGENYFLSLNIFRANIKALVAYWCSEEHYFWKFKRAGYSNVVLKCRTQTMIFTDHFSVRSCFKQRNACYSLFLPTEFSWHKTTLGYLNWPKWQWFEQVQATLCLNNQPK